MEPLTNPQIRKLKAMAQRLEPMLHVGKAGLSDSFFKTLEDALESRELVKLRFGELKEQKEELAPLIAEKTRSHKIMRVGHVLVLYRQHPDPAKRKVHI